MYLMNNNLNLITNDQQGPQANHITAYTGENITNKQDFSISWNNKSL